MRDKIEGFAKELGRELAQRHKCVTFAESCTGGGFAEAITRVPGSSKFFEMSFVTYSNRAKSKILGVPPENIERFGAVSEIVARAMLAGALVNSGADFGLAVSGIAGPDGGTPGKPVGTVCMAWGQRGSVHAQTFLFKGDRAQIRMDSVATGLLHLIHSVKA